MKDLTEYCRIHYEKAESVIHRWGHIERTARGAVWFCTMLKGDEREAQLAYVAGILHDIVRPATEKKCHAHASAEKAQVLLNQYPEFTPSQTYRICQAIRDHRTPVLWKTPLHQSVYLSDKICEHMGAYLDFRAPVWAGELSHSDFSDLEPVEAVLEYYKKSSPKFLTGTFPDRVTPLVDYQTGWNRRFCRAVEASEEWAIDMAESLFFSGREKKDFEDTLSQFFPHGTQQKKWAKEMRKYIGGETFNHFHHLLRDK